MTQSPSVTDYLAAELRGRGLLVRYPSSDSLEGLDPALLALLDVSRKAAGKAAEHLIIEPNALAIVIGSSINFASLDGMPSLAIIDAREAVKAKTQTPKP